MQSVSVFLDITKAAGFREKILMSADIKMCANLFVYVLNLLWVRYNCAKFHHCRICVRDLRKGVFLLAPHL